MRRASRSQGDGCGRTVPPSASRSAHRRSTGRVARWSAGRPAGRISTVAMSALLVTGQMAASVAFDHFGVMGLTQRSLDLPRLIGVLLLIGRVVLVRQ